MSEPVITTVIPTYKRPQLLERAVRSVLAQTYPHLIVKVFDNASGDETAEVVARIAAEDSRVRYHCHDTNLGALANFEYALASIETPYFSILSDDDVLLPGFFKHATDCLADHEGARFFCGQWVVYNTSSRSHRVRPSRLWQDGFYPAGSPAVKMGWDSFVWTSCLFSKEMLPDLTPLRRTLPDTLFMMKAPALFPFVVSLVPCAVFTAHPDTLTSGISPEAMLSGYRSALGGLAHVQALTLDELKEFELSFRAAIRKSVGKQLRQALLAEQWSAFEEAARVLLKTGEARSTQKVLCMLAHGRSKSGMLIRLLRTYLSKKARRKSSRPRQERDTSSFDEVVIRYENAAIQKAREQP